MFSICKGYAAVGKSRASELESVVIFFGWTIVCACPSATGPSLACTNANTYCVYLPLSRTATYRRPPAATAPAATVAYLGVAHARHNLYAN